MAPVGFDRATAYVEVQGMVIDHPSWEGKIELTAFSGVWGSGFRVREPGKYAKMLARDISSASAGLRWLWV